MLGGIGVKIAGFLKNQIHFTIGDFRNVFKLMDISSA